MCVKKTMFVCILGFAILVCLGVCFARNQILRNTIISKCDSSLDCDCFTNIVKYRFSNQELVAFGRFLDTLPIRSNVDILEFTDRETAQNISYLVSLCRKVPSDSEIQSEPDNNVQNNRGESEGENQIQIKG